MPATPSELCFDLSDSKLGDARPAGGPTPPASRIASLDVLRGFALLGILVLNIEMFSGPEGALHDVPLGLAKPAFVGWHAGLDLAIFAAKWMFFEGKMRTLFSMLYGAGIVLLTQRFEARAEDGKAADIFCRRNLWLLLFGLIHGTLIWGGDILSQYALIALLLMFPFRRVGGRRLVILGAVVGILGGSLGVLRMSDAPAEFRAERVRQEAAAAAAHHQRLSAEQDSMLASDAREASEAPARIARQLQEGRASYAESIAPRAEAYFGFVEALFRSGWILEVVGSMFIGMGLFKLGFLTGELSRRRYLLIAAAGYAVALPIILSGVEISARHGFAAATVLRSLFLPYPLEVFAASIANASVILAVERSRWFRPVARALANVGRTAFSNYILTSLICQFAFGWGPWKLYGSIEYYQQLYAVAAVWAFNLVVSALWLRVFRFGPLEWAWRSLVYWCPQPMRR